MSRGARAIRTRNIAIGAIIPQLRGPEIFGFKLGSRSRPGLSVAYLLVQVFFALLS